MAKFYVYAVFDSKVKTFAQPFLMRTRGEALRGWSEVANDKNTSISKHAEDYSLMELGEYDDQTGTYENKQAPENLGLASQFKKVESFNVTAISQGA